MLVESGRYRETIVLSSRHTGVVFRGTGDSRPVIDGEGVRAHGFKNINGDRVTIENFELTGQTAAGIYSQGTADVFAGNVIHHIGSATETHSNGIRVARGSSNRLVRNAIHHIGPGAQSMGIWLVQTRDAEVEGNSVYLVRKEGVRDWQGLDNSITDNRVFLNWVGISLNTSTGSTVTNNYVYDNVEGFAVKHASYAPVLRAWNLDRAHWSRIWHNTVFRSTETALWLAQSGEPLDYVDVRNNFFSGAGTAFVRDRPELRGANVVVDGNAYADQGGRPTWVYKEGWSSRPGLTDWDTLRGQTGWESSGGSTLVPLIAPSLGDLDYADADMSWLRGLDLGGARGTQVGARGLDSSKAIWTPYEMTPVDSSSKGTWSTNRHLDNTADNDQDSYWVTSGSENEYVVYDLGRMRTFNHLILTVYSHEDLRNVRGYRFELSDDGHAWHTIRDGVNADASGAAYPYEMASPATGRYLRFTMIDTFCQSYTPRTGCGQQFVLSDLKAGMLSDAVPTPEPKPQTSVAVSAARPTAPAPATLIVGRRIVLTRKGDLLVKVTCSGSAVQGRGSVKVTGTVRRAKPGRRSKPLALGRVGVRVTPHCRRTVKVPVRRSLRARIRRGGVTAVRVAATAPGGPATLTTVRITR